MTTLFLKAKHWQLFVLFCVMPMVLDFVLTVTMFINTVLNNNFDSAEKMGTILIEYISIFGLVTAFTLLIIYGWYSSIALVLRSKIPAHLRMKLYLFIPAFLPPLIYLATMKYFPAHDITLENIQSLDFSYLILEGLFQLFCIASLFYIFYFTAKTFKTAELQRELKFSDYSSELFMLCLFPIGVWLIQPKLNAMVNTIPSDSSFTDQ